MRTTCRPSASSSAPGARVGGWLAGLGVGGQGSGVNLGPDPDFGLGSPLPEAAFCLLVPPAPVMMTRSPSGDDDSAGCRDDAPRPFGPLLLAGRGVPTPDPTEGWFAGHRRLPRLGSSAIRCCHNSPAPVGPWAELKEGKRPRFCWTQPCSAPCTSSAHLLLLLLLLLRAPWAWAVPAGSSTVVGEGLLVLVWVMRLKPFSKEPLFPGLPMHSLLSALSCPGPVGAEDWGFLPTPLLR